MKQPQSPLEILYEDNHYIAVNKQAGWLVQGDQTGDKPMSEMVKDYIREKYQKPGNVFTGVIHRLDRPVSGAVIFARTSKGLERMNRLFKEKKVQKTYWAMVEKSPSKTSDKLIHHLSRLPRKNITRANAHPVKDSKESILEYQLIKKTKQGFLLEVNPHTGRQHQIRVQLAAIGCSIIGDLKYGAKAAMPDKSICLHSRSLSFEHPIKKIPILIQASCPFIG